MDKLVVHGGSVIKGSVNISGSKNASLPILAAAILTGEDCIIRRVPDVSDTNYMLWSDPPAPSASPAPTFPTRLPTNSSAACAPRSA
jgi:hypothetical protein